METLNVIKNKEMESKLFWLCWIAYFTSYIGRLNYSSAMPEMIRHHILSASEAGIISMIYFLLYGIGQMLNGFLGDYIHPRKMIFAGLFFSSLSNAFMGFLEGFGQMVVCWGINGYLQSMIWSPIIRIFAEMLEETVRVKYCINITSTMALGTLTSYLLSAVAIFVGGWKAIFWIASLCILTVALFFDAQFRKVELYAKKFGEKPKKSSQSLGKEEMKANSDSFFKFVCYSGVYLVLIPVIIHGVLKDGMVSWVPTYISETFHTSATISVLVTTILPLVNLTGAYAAHYMYRKFFKRQETKTAIFFFFISTVALLFLWRFSDDSILLTVLFLSVITSAMMAVNTLFVNLLPIRFVYSGRVSTVSGFLNSAAYLGTAIASLSIGILVEKGGWSITICSWLCLSIVAIIMCIVIRNKSYEERGKNI